MTQRITIEIVPKPVIPPPTVRCAITPAEYDFIRSHPHKVASIKFIRLQYDLGLKDAKDVVDAVYSGGSRFGLEDNTLTRHI